MTPPELECEQALALLQDYLKQEVTPELIPLIEQHLKRCGPCLQSATFERNFLELLGEPADRVTCPASLRRKLIERLREQL